MGEKLLSMPKFCPSCGSPLQNENANHCPSCGAAIQSQPVASQPVQAQPAPVQPVAQPIGQTFPVQSQKNPIIAVALCFFFPGAGQVYNGDLKRGAMFLIGQLVGTLLLILPGIIVWFYAMYDAYKTANQMNAGLIPYQETNMTEVILYLVLVIVGSVIFVVLFFILAAVLAAFVFGMAGNI